MSVAPSEVVDDLVEVGRGCAHRFRATSVYMSTNPLTVVAQSKRAAASPARGDERAASTLVVDQRGDPGRELVGVGRIDEEGGVADDLRDGAPVRRDHRDARGHGLERWEPEALVERRVREHGGAREQVAPLLVGHVAEPADAVAVTCGADRVEELVVRPAVGPGHDEREVAVVTHAVERTHQGGKVLRGSSCRSAST